MYVCATSKYLRANNYCVAGKSHGISLCVDQLLIQLIVFQCILKGQAEEDAKGEKDQRQTEIMIINNFSVFVSCL